MTPLIPIMLFGWIPISIFLFKRYDTRIAILLSLIGGFLFLPMAKYDMPVIAYTKNTAIVLGILIGLLLKKNIKKLTISKYDIAMVLWVFFIPYITSISNSLGFYDGFAASVSNYFTWGFFYFLGRKYFKTISDLELICMGVIIGGLIYAPLCLFEVRMSPQLSIKVYGFFPHSFMQHIRYGGFRPIVFMKHGLMVALWMSTCAIISFWFWRCKSITLMKTLNRIRLSPFIVVMILILTTITCKSAGAIVFLIIGISSWFLYKLKKRVALFSFLFFFIITYFIIRMNNIISVDKIESTLSNLFDSDRMESLIFRLRQEDLFSVKAREKFLFGWGGWGRNRPIDPRTGTVIGTVDSLWLIVYSVNGISGLFCLFYAMLIGPWKIVSAWGRSITVNKVEPYILSLIIILFMIDCLLNGMVNPIYIFISGALLSFFINTKHDLN